MDNSILNKYKPGVRFNSAGQAEIVLWAPEVQKAEVVLSGRNEIISLTRQELGYWTATTEKIKPGDLYKFRLNGEKELSDPVSLSLPEGVHGPSKAVKTADFVWSDGNWYNHPLDEYILYEIHTGTFTSEGTFASIEEKLDYLKELGITAIELMPVAQFPGERNWGYDGVAPFAVQNSYGGPEGLQHLVNACHRKNIAVILDVVYNHLGPEGNYLPEFGPYFTSKYNTPWGNAVNFDDEYSYGVRQYFIENALMWFRDFHIDALRLDAVHAIKDFSPTHILREIRMELDKLMSETGRKHYLIVELDLNDNRFINPLEKGGYGMDAQWIDEFHHALRVTAGEEQTGYYSDFHGITHLAKAYQDAYVYDGQFSEHRKKFFGIKADENPASQFIVFSQNHDQVGNRMCGERINRLLSFEMKKLVAASVLLSPYLPMLFMGEEWVEPNPFLYFVSHTDPQLAESVRKGRKEEFADFHGQGEAPDPVSEKTFQQSKLQWHLPGQKPHSTVLNYYKKLISLRKTHPVLKNSGRKEMRVSSDQTTETLVLQRWYENNMVVCLMNFSEKEQQIMIPEIKETWTKIIHSADTEWHGSNDFPDTYTAGETITLQPESVLVLE